MKFNPTRIDLVSDDQLWDLRRSVVIPLPGDRALRFGFNIEAWCKRGPRHYQVVAHPRVVESLAEMTETSEDEQREYLRDMGVEAPTWDEWVEQKQEGARGSQP